MKAPSAIRISALCLFSCASPLLSAATITCWADGVSKTSGYKSVAQGSTNLCSAATASNMLAHYFNVASSRGISVSADAPTTSYPIFNYFCSVLDTSKGTYVCSALERYISDNGSYFNGNAPTVKYKYGFSWLDSGVELSAILIDALSSGSTAGISYEGYANHAVTVWGIEYNDQTNIVSKIWVTDSNGDTDDLIEYTGIAIQGKSSNFYFYEITVDPDTGSTSQGAGFYVTSVTWLETPSIPEPSSLGILAGVLAIAAISSRRKRK